MTFEPSRQFYQEFEQDPDLFTDMTPYIYSAEKSDAAVLRNQQLGWVHIATMLNDKPIGEIILKRIDSVNMHCTLSICMQSNTYKNQGYGTVAEILALDYAFDQMNMKTVYADAIHKNIRSQRDLEKVGFKETQCDDIFIYYRCDKSRWNRPKMT